MSTLSSPATSTRTPVIGALIEFCFGIPQSDEFSKLSKRVESIDIRRPLSHDDRLDVDSYCYQLAIHAVRTIGPAEHRVECYRLAYRHLRSRFGINSEKLSNNEVARLAYLSEQSGGAIVAYNNALEERYHPREASESNAYRVPCANQAVLLADLKRSNLPPSEARATLIGTVAAGWARQSDITALGDTPLRRFAKAAITSTPTLAERVVVELSRPQLALRGFCADLREEIADLRRRIPSRSEIEKPLREVRQAIASMVTGAKRWWGIASSIAAKGRW